MTILIGVVYPEELPFPGKIISYKNKTTRNMVYVDTFGNRYHVSGFISINDAKLPEFTLDDETYAKVSNWEKKK